MPTYVTPGVYYESVDLAPQRIPLLPTDVAGFVGIAERGPVHEPRRLASWQQFQSVFGGLIGAGFLAYSVKAFFENGGRVCYVVRVASEEKATASADVVDASGARILRVEASSPGSWANRIEVRLVRSSPAATRSLPSRAPAAGRDSSRVESGTGFAVGSLVRVAEEGVPGRASLRVVREVDARASVVVWDEPLDASVRVDRALVLETVEFALGVYVDRQLRELLSSIPLVTFGRPPADRVLAAGHLVRVCVHESQDAQLAPASFHAPAAAALEFANSPARWRTALSGGADGLATLSREHFTGSRGEETPRGLRALEEVDEVAIVAVPDILVQPLPEVVEQPPPKLERDECLPPFGVEPEPGASVTMAAPEQPPRFSPTDVFAVQQALVAHCEERRDRIAILDAPPSTDLGQIQAWRARFDSKYAALYYPWVLVHEPRARALVRAVPPSGHVAGVYARVDIESGVHRAPANEELEWAAGLTVEVTPEQQGLLNPIGINCLRAFQARGIRVYGARTVSSDASWRFVNVRRLLSAIEEAVEEAVQWSVFEPNNHLLRQTLTLAISSFLEELWSRGALVGATTAEAFFVKCDEENNPPSVSDAGRLVADVGVAPVKPAEFVVFRIGRAENELEIVG